MTCPGVEAVMLPLGLRSVPGGTPVLVGSGKPQEWGEEKQLECRVEVRLQLLVCLA
jgi:hypothetical protein